MIFTQIIDEVAPFKEIRIKTRTEPWINNEILEQMHERDKTLYKSNQDKENTELRDSYKNQRNAVTSTVRQAKANYFCNKIETNGYPPFYCCPPSHELTQTW